MSKQLSFNQLENELIHELRNNINNSEGPIDVANYFSLAVCKLLKEVFANEVISISDSSVLFDPKNLNYYKVNEVLSKNDHFQEIWGSSDLKNVISRFAELSYHKYLHHNKHAEKTNKKIRKV